MRLLVDTHALLWWILDDPALSPSARRHLGNPGNGILVSSASAWEIATKFRIGRLPDADELVADFEGYLARQHFEAFPISIDYAVRAGLLPGPHKDPFDRMLIAQAQAESLPIVSKDVIFDSYGIRRLW
jgi:PIN domain nuclease of toxin-antitoxin system